MTGFYSALQRREDSDAAPADGWTTAAALCQTAASEAEEEFSYRTVNLNIAAGPLIPFDESNPRIAEQYRVLRTNILLHSARPRVIAISSGSLGDGKTVTSINLAGILALKSDANVLLVDADLRQCKVATSLGIPSSPGLADVLQDRCSLEEAIVQVEEIPNLLVLPAGEATGNPAELLDSVPWKRAIMTLRAHFSYTIVDTTPVTAVADFQLVQQVCDAVLFVLRPDHTKRSLLEKALSAVPKEKLLGTVLNAVPDWFLWNIRESYYASKDETEPC